MEISEELELAISQRDAAKSQLEKMERDHNPDIYREQLNQKEEELSRLATQLEIEESNARKALEELKQEKEITRFLISCIKSGEDLTLEEEESCRAGKLPVAIRKEEKGAGK